MTSRSTNPGSSHHPAPSSSSGFPKVPAIHLSHAAKQRAFVERLHEALRRANHRSFFDQVSLLRAHCITEELKRAARECTLGVVVLTEDYVTSKWPLIELTILVQERGRNAKLLPLFYKLRPEDLKSPVNLDQWRKRWEDWDESTGSERIPIWEDSLRVLSHCSGEIYEEGTSEGEYIKRVVKSICTQVACPLPYDMSAVVGHERLAQVVAGKFDSVRCASRDGGASMVGLHGVDGLGKSTMCKIMANFYSSMYPGKSHHLELPNRGCDMRAVVEKCKQALRVLAELDDDFLKLVHSFDQVIKLMKIHLPLHDVFLAIDNAVESTQMDVGRIVKVGFSAESKILVTSRSEEFLNELLRNQKNSCVCPCPLPTQEED